MGSLALDGSQRATLLALADVLVPSDVDPSASEAGFATFVERVWKDLGARYHERLLRGLDALDVEARTVSRDDAGLETGFAALSHDRATTLVAALHEGRVSTEWRRGAVAGFLRETTSLVIQSYYGDPGNGGNADGRSWERIGFRAGPKRPFVSPAVAPLAVTEAGAMAPEYDVVVVGAGAGGGIVACVLAEAGERVLLLDRGDALEPGEVGRDHLRNHRFSVYGHNTGPDLSGHPRVAVGRGTEHVVFPHEAAYQNNAMTVGGGTRVYAGQAWRFAPEDFRMQSLYGVPEGSSLSDWPIDYDTLAPFYERAEHEIGVCGETGHSHAGPRDRYPMPPIDSDFDGPVLRSAGKQLGWNVRALPLSINSVPYGGRPSCVACGTCVGFACTSEAKNGTANTVIPRALATGRCDLVTRAHVAEIETDSEGQARAVRLFVEGPAGDQLEGRVEARVIVLSAGAIETARLLLLSRSESHPDGLGNAWDQVGRNLQGHLYSGAVGLHPDPIRTGLGPGNAIATCDFNHGNEGVIGGGMLANESPFPVQLFSLFLPDLPRWGAAGKEAMAEAYRRTLVVMGPAQEIPNPEARVTLDPVVRDRHGLPVARLSGTIHSASLGPAAFLRDRAEEWVRATGATSVRSWPGGDPNGLSGGQHQAGTCRMGTDPRTSVTDAAGLVHGQRSLYIADGSLHVTNGGFNPMLTIMANSYRIAAGIVSRSIGSYP